MGEHTEGIECADDIARCRAKGILVQVLVLEAIHGAVGACIRIGTLVGALPSHGWLRERPLSGRDGVVLGPAFVVGLARRDQSVDRSCWWRGEMRREVWQPTHDVHASRKSTDCHLVPGYAFSEIWIMQLSPLWEDGCSRVGVVSLWERSSWDGSVNQRTVRQIVLLVYTSLQGQGPDWGPPLREVACGPGCGELH